MIKSLAVYCGARNGNDEKYLKKAYELGEWLAAHQIDLVYGGGQFGIMGAVANGVLDKGGTVHGIITETLASRGAAYSKIQDLKIVPDMDQRKEKMMAMANGMLALPGGIGTLEEISQAASWITIGENPKPVAFYNQDGFYSPLERVLAHMCHEGFLEKTYFDSMYFSDDFNQILQFMEHYKAPKYRTYEK
ncbi:TIGR00730 family Rossman fold protein [Limosilactobacillus fastidiosus]|uniref:Cytokinin riboside 5'-monophosphate phosphoribohydrolase n=1 Tax=Limosilactobacillus fastidiosus TaxID=2759855 RepID=A0A7W3YCE9_9LACO|nr:TIGR00730 family Rossman fold protein [Limosilactobacillus fastidiosus]MBB1086041.1 TIGR00730 family Rossman fold protein [Limosilactobacillus fastidiosus]MCD7085618.1 TIGR00730 family Rossman fold protein [Limosilactobacillus fastidiosus]MCD7114174.1 TIGR00730 family Rossman fold protein [Limosilactobacillus fastidiosus]MCD7116692.1 TIGR00730 family Rossman fold protein [Limosilactobacillus fastidiosus]